MKAAKNSAFRYVLVIASALALTVCLAATALADGAVLDDSNCRLKYDEFEYTGTAPDLQVQYTADGADPVVLPEDAYTLTYKNADGEELATAPVDAADYKVVVAGVEESGFSGEVELDVAITPAAMTADNTMLSATSSTYDASVKAPTVKWVIAGGKVSVPSENYTIAWFSDSGCTAAATPKYVGTYYAQITFSGNFASAAPVVKEYTIKARKMTSSSTVLGTTSYTFSNQTKKPTVRLVTDSGKLTIASSNYTITWYSDSKCTTKATPKKAGTYYAKIEFKDNYSGTVSGKKITIAKKALTTSMVVLGTSTYTYDGKVHAPSVKYKWSSGTITLARNTSYTVVYYTDKKCTVKTSKSKNGASDAGKAPKKGGTYYMKITGKGSYKGTITKSFKIYYKATYKLNGGTNSAANKAKYISTFKLYEPTKKGYTFMGWYTTSTFKSSSKVTSCKTGSNRTLYAKWTEGNKPGSYSIGATYDKCTRLDTAGLYYFKILDPSKSAYVLVYKSEAAFKSGSSTGIGAFDSMYYAKLSKGQVVTTVNCSFRLSSKCSHTARTSLTENDCGLYKVGTDLAAGTYRFSKTDKTGWSLQVFSSAAYCGSNPDKSKAKYYQTKAGTITLNAGTYAKIEHATLTKV